MFISLLVNQDQNARRFYSTAPSGAAERAIWLIRSVSFPHAVRPKADISVRVKLYRSGSLPRSHAGVFEKNRLYGLETSSRDLSLVRPSIHLFSSLRGSNNKFDSYVSSKCLCSSRVRGLNLTRFSRVSPSARHGETPP